MNYCYIVIKQGAYQQGVYGVSLFESFANVHADHLADNDDDSHHTWDVYKVELNSYKMNDMLTERISTRKKGGESTNDKPNT